LFSGCEVPGVIRFFDSNGTVCQTRHFPAGGEYEAALEPGSLEMHGNRGTDLGCNMWGWLGLFIHCRKNPCLEATVVTDVRLCGQHLKLLAGRIRKWED